MKVLLNVVKKENFVFFDPVNKIHLNRTNPFGDVTVLSDSLRRAIVAGNVIDVDNEFNIELSSKVKNINEALLKSLKIQPKIKEVEIIEEAPVEEKVLLENIDLVVDEEVKEEIKEEVKEEKKKKSKKVVK